MIENYVLENNLPVNIFPIYLTFKNDLEMQRNTIVLLQILLLYNKEDTLDKSSAVYIECHLFCL